MISGEWNVDGCDKGAFEVFSDETGIDKVNESMISRSLSSAEEDRFD